MFTTDLQIRKWKDSAKARKSCGKGLYIRIFGDGSKVFEFRTQAAWITIGNYPHLSLADATDIVSMAKRLLKSNTVTVEALRSLMTRAETARQLEDLVNNKVASTLAILEMKTFDQAYRDWYSLQLKANRWTSIASKRRPISAYENHAEKHFGNLRIDSIRRPMIKQLFQPLLLDSTETASKLLGYTWEVFELAYDDELIGHNPCPRVKSFTVPNKPVRHAASLHYSRFPELWQWLNDAPFSESVKMAMRLSVVSVHRASVVSNMRWEHFDCDKGIWTIPAKDISATTVGFMKSGRKFSMQLPNGISEALCALPRKCDYVFTVDGLKPINAETLRRNFQKFDKITTHGFRNTFKTWALNQEPPIDAFLVDRYCDHALAGLDKNYRRDDLFTKRAELAERYYDYCKGFEWFVRRSRS